MDPEKPDIEPPSLPEGRFSGLTDFTQLIRQSFSAAAVQGWREIIVCDPDFGDWPLGERAMIEALNDWSMTGRKFTMLAKNYEWGEGTQQNGEMAINTYKDIIRKAIRNWMNFKNLSNIPIEPKYILNVISSSAGIEGWAKCYNSSA